MFSSPPPTTGASSSSSRVRGRSAHSRSQSQLAYACAFFLCLAVVYTWMTNNHNAASSSQQSIINSKLLFPKHFTPDLGSPILNRFPPSSSSSVSSPLSRSSSSSSSSLSSLSSLSSSLWSFVLSLCLLFQLCFATLSAAHTQFVPFLLTHVSFLSHLPPFLTVMLSSCLIVVTFLIVHQLMRFMYTSIFGQRVFLVGMTTFHAPSNWPHVTAEMFSDIAEAIPSSSKEARAFAKKVLSKSGIDGGVFPPGFLRRPADLSFASSRSEAEFVLTTCVDNIFKHTHCKPTDVDILVVNCSLFCPTPSLSAMIVNHYKMRTDIKSFNLGGMGCSASLISVALARDLLQVHKKSVALVLSTEAITPNMYCGTRLDMLVQNALFRVGGAAMLLTNYMPTKRTQIKSYMQTENTRSQSSSSSASSSPPSSLSSLSSSSVPTESMLASTSSSASTSTTTATTTAAALTATTMSSATDVTPSSSPSSSSSGSSSSSSFSRSCYELESLVRVHIGSSTASYDCVYQIEDEDGFKGIRLNKDVVKHASKALELNLRRLGPLVLPYSELLYYCAHTCYRSAYILLRDMKKRLHTLMKMQPNETVLTTTTSVTATTSFAGMATTTTTGTCTTTSSTPETKTSATIVSTAATGIPAPYMPNWEKAIEHWAIHAGGRGVIDAIQSGLGLSSGCCMGSRCVLRRHGNTSSSSIWYEFEWFEANGLTRPGHRIIQVAFGSGFKCNTAVWKRVA